jgi:radical SAM protein with 4Fe4S-binding SPASM domain
MGSNRGGYVVSPYLASIPDPVVDSWAAAREHQHEVDAPIAGRGMFYDLLRQRLLVTSREDKLRLELWRREPEGIDALAELEPETFRLFTGRELLLHESDAFRQHRYICVEIEINRHCNFRCSFCPVEKAPKPKAFMAPELFSLVLDRVKEYGAPSISLNHYSEPTLDPLLTERIRLAAERGLKVRLHTNASLLDEGKIRALAALGNTALVINLPTVDRAEYERVTGTKFFDRVIANLRLIHEQGIPTQLSINAPRDSADENVRRINEMFATMFGESVAWPTDTRIGRVEKSEYATDVRHAGLLAGCRYALDQINVSHDGRVFLCCQDFEQEYVIGDLRQSTLSEIAESERMVQLRRWIFGGGEPPADFICSRCSWTCSLGEKPGPLTIGMEVGRLTIGAQGRELERASKDWPIVFAVGGLTPSAGRA